MTTCYPSSVPADAEAIRVDRGDLEEIEIRMRHGRTYAISGRVLDASGVAAGNALLSLGQYVSGGSTSWGIRIDESGTFAASNIPPGDYAIQATLGGVDRPEQRRPYEAGFVAVTVNGDLDGIVVRMQPAFDVPGRILLEEPAVELPPGMGSGLTVTTRLVEDRMFGYGSTSHAYVQKDRTFTLKRIFGRRVLNAYNLPPGWYVKSMHYDGREVTDTGIEFKDVPDPPTLDVMLASRGASVVGRVVDDGGHAVSRALVLVFPPNYRPGDIVATRSAAADGSFRFGPARSGSYLLVALPRGSASVHPAEPERLARLMAAAERVTLGELEERIVDLRVFTER